MAQRWEKIRPYAVELLAALLLCAILFMCFRTNQVLAWLLRRKSDALVLAGIAAGTSGIIFGAYFNVLSTDFGRRLRLANAAVEYAIAFAVPLVGFFATVVALIVLSERSDGVLVKALIFLLVYSCINCYTMVRNVIDLVGVWQDVEKARHSGRI